MLDGGTDNQADSDNPQDYQDLYVRGYLVEGKQTKYLDENRTEQLRDR